MSETNVPNATQWQIECASCGKLHFLMELHGKPDDVGEFCLDPTLMIHCTCGVYIQQEQQQDGSWKSYVVARKADVDARWRGFYSDRASLQ